MSVLRASLLRRRGSGAAALLSTPRSSIWQAPLQALFGTSRARSPSVASSTNAVSNKKRSLAQQRRQQELKDARWREFVLALRTFYENEGHFAVPPRFVVPAPSPFPFKFSSVQRGSGSSPARAAAAEAQGSDKTATVVPHHLRPESWAKELHGLALGLRVRTFIRAVERGAQKQSVEQLAELQQLGFPWRSWDAYHFENVTVPALTTYAQLEGDLFVPQKFIVPYGDLSWPRSTWGVPLGIQVAKLRKQRDQRALEQYHVDTLERMGFVWKVRDAKWFQYFLPGLRIFRELHGHADVPLAFVIPEQSSTGINGDESSDSVAVNAWPQHLGGYMLGRHVYMVRSGKYSSQVEESRGELEALGFSFNLSETAWLQTIFPALRMFAEEFHHCDVHQEFVVPPTAPWPEKAWGLKLGHTVKSIRQGAYEDQVQAYHRELEQIDFIWNAKQRLAMTVRQVVLPAMATYRKLHGHVLISTDFAVPNNDAAWPEPTRGFKLGHWITRARSGHVDVPGQLRKELDQVGFVWRFNDARWNEILLPSFRVYAQLNGTCKGMSTKFHVPHELPYPEKAWGANLGGAVWHMRNGDTYVNDEEKQLELRRLGVL
ncbi:hypothetical protein Gpo141_00012780 [Globisporangium polare]